MNFNVSGRTVCRASVFFVSVVISSAPAFAQGVEKLPKSDQVANENQVVSTATTAFDADLDDDGIIDAVEKLTSLRSADTKEEPEKSAAGNNLEKDLTKGFRTARRVSRPQARNTCMDYMMLSPEDREKVDLKVQSRGLGVFGTRPCDPFVSPDLERPFDNNYIEVPLLPRASVIVRDTLSD
jgi:hypothetical protein